MFFCSFRVWLRLLWINRFEWQYLHRVLLITLTSFITIPFRILEKIIYGKRVAETVIHEDPIFIIGYPRSGTTHLHNLISQDPNLGFVTQFQTLAPEAVLVGHKLLRPLLNRLLPAKRPQDNVQMALDYPQEEEHAIGNMSIHSEFHAIFFPKKMRAYVTKYALFADLEADAKTTWQQMHRAVLQKATFICQKRLVLKTPANVARIATLLQMYPDAKFIHIYRNPFTIFPSQKKTLIEATNFAALQTVSQAEIEANIFFFYTEMMQRFFKDKALLNHANFVEVQFEQLESNPLAELQRIYDQLNLPGFAQAQDNFKAYNDHQKDYEKNRYALDPQTAVEIKERWHFTISKWGYENPQ